MVSRSPRRRILLVVNSVGWAGAETQTCYLAAGLSESGHSVVLLAIGGIWRDIEPLERAGVRVVALGTARRAAKLAAALKIARYARQADMVHCSGWDATLWGRIGAFLARRPVVITEHTPGRHLQITETGAPRGRAIALHNRLLDRVTYATVAVGSWQIGLLESEGVRPDSIVHIHNAVPVEELRERSSRGPDRASLSIPTDARVVIQVARFSPQKGQSTTLRTVARLRQALGDVRALFVGSGQDEAGVKREAAELQADWACFLGSRQDVPGLLRLADIAVLPSSGEGLPMSLIEAMAIGTPIVATDVGDVRWLLESTGAGLCVPAGDEDAFERACARLLGDADLRARIGDAASMAAMGFDAGDMVQRYERVLEAAIAGAPLPTPAVDG
jgi:L-malate glycosyltransferase